jgi:hypothetical protein
VCGNGTLSTDTTYVVSITVSDASGSSTHQQILSSAFFPIDVKPGGKGVGGVAIGKVAELPNVFDIGLPIRIGDGIIPIEIDSNTDLNTIVLPGIYRCFMSNTAATLTNSPTDVAFMLEVLPNHEITQRLVEYKEHVFPRTFIRNYYNDTWGQWYEYVPRQTKIANPVSLIGLGEGETYVFPSDGYLVVKASYRAGYYVNCTLYGSNGIGIDVSVTSGAAGNMQGNPSNIMFVRQGMYVGNISANSTSYNILQFNPLY